MRACIQERAAWVLILLLSKAAMGSANTLDGVAAYVNDHVITGSDVLEASQPARQQALSKYQGDELQATWRKVHEDALNSLVERRLILDAYDKMERKIPDWAVDARINEIIHESFNDERENLMVALSKGRVTFEEWRSQIKEHIIVSMMRGERIERHTRLSPQAMRAAYDSDKDKYRMPEKVWLRLIALKLGASDEETAAKRKLAADIRQRLEAGEDFASLAKAKSEGSKAENGGDWGWIEPRMLRPELAKAVAGMKPSELSGVLETKDELYIIKLEERKDGSVPSFADVQPQIERDLRQEEGKVLYAAWMDALRKTSYVKVLDVSSYMGPLPK